MSRSQFSRFLVLSVALGLVVASAYARGSGDSYQILVDADGAYLGVRLTEETEHSDGGARVTHVVDNSPADEAGIREDDIIVEFDGRPVRGPATFTKRIGACEPGGEVSIKVVRDGQPKSLRVVLGSRSVFSGVTPQWSWDGDEWRAWQESMKSEVESLGQRLGRSYSFTLPEGNRDMSFFVDWGRPKLGVQLVETTPELREHLGGGKDEGVLVSKVLSGTPAARAGLVVGDLIVTVDGESVASVDELRAALGDKEGQTFPVVVVREHRRVSLEVTITEPEGLRPTGPQACFPGPAAPAAPWPPPAPARAATAV